MKTAILSFLPRCLSRGRFLCSMVLITLLCGCLPTERVVWSPDGRQAVVLGDDGMFLTDETGQLSEMLLPEVRLAQWFADSRRLLLVALHKADNWGEIAQDLPTDRKALLKELAESTWTKLTQDESWDSIKKALAKDHGMGEAEIDAIQLYLRDHHGAEVAEKLSKSDEEWQNLTADRSVMVLARIEDGRVAEKEVLMADVVLAMDLRLSSTEEAALFTTFPQDEQAARLYAVPLKEPLKAKLVRPSVALYPDWSADGRSVVFIHTLGGQPHDDEVQLGVLVRQRLLTEDGQLEISEEKEELVGMLFSATSRVRCLRDGRILFSCFETKLPMTVNDFDERQQIYALDPSRQATLSRVIPRQARSRLPEDLSYFTVSPDEKRLAIAGKESSVGLIQIASGELVVLQEALAKNNDLRTVPNWKGNDQVCFVGVDPEEKDEEEPTMRILLWKDGDVRVLNQGWPESVIDGVVQNADPRIDPALGNWSFLLPAARGHSGRF